MTDEALIRLYNIGCFQRTVSHAPDHYTINVEIDGDEIKLKLSELENILRANADRLRAAKANQKPVKLNLVAQPYAKQMRFYV